jgi:hypothetical protein
MEQDYPKLELMVTLWSYTCLACLQSPSNSLRVFGNLWKLASHSNTSGLLGFGTRLLHFCGRMGIVLFRRVRNRLCPVKPNLSGDREIEWSWTIAMVPVGKGMALDIGGAKGYLGLALAHAGWTTTVVDLQPCMWGYQHPHLRFVQGDVKVLPFPKQSFNVITCCSTVEHIGLFGRYGTAFQENDGDIETMARLRELLKVDGLLILTVPVGQDAIFAPLHRVYGAERLPKLLKGYEVLTDSYWIKGQDNRWINVSRDRALSEQTFTTGFDSQRNYYGLGCFTLRPAKSASWEPSLEGVSVSRGQVQDNQRD